MKAYTDIEQSKKLAEILPPEYIHLLKKTPTYNMSQAIINIEKATTKQKIL